MNKEKKVIKKSGNIEDFDPEKIKNSVFSAAKEAGYDENQSLVIAEEVLRFVLDSIVGVEQVDSNSLRDLILNKLDEDYPEIAQKWRDYEEKKEKGIKN